jgi:hypothetical protein
MFWYICQTCFCLKRRTYGNSDVIIVNMIYKAYIIWTCLSIKAVCS